MILLKTGTHLLKNNSVFSGTLIAEVTEDIWPSIYSQAPNTVVRFHDIL